MKKPLLSRYHSTRSSITLGELCLLGALIWVVMVIGIRIVEAS